MATPAMLRQNISASVAPQNAGSIRCNTFNANGTVLDVHTGFTLSSLHAQSNSAPNNQFAAIDLSGSVTAAFDATGVTLSYTMAQANSIAAALPAQQNTVDIVLTNDSGTTSSCAGRVTLAVDQISGALD